MAIKRIGNEGFGWDVFRPLTNLWRRVGRRRARRNKQPVNLWLLADDPAMREAILAVRMAANLGEDYDKVSERIEQEAARYQEFLRNPTLIGKITLNTKRVHTDAPAGEVCGRVYQVRDPAEGQASVVYNLDRSEGLVLEFIVHDRNDQPLFPVVRTYSDWLGERTFDLGAGRTFFLKMTEGECPLKVRVQASFSTTARARAKAGGLPLAAGDEDEGYGKSRTNGAGAGSFGRPTYAFGMAALFLLALAWSLRPHILDRPPDVPISKQTAKGVSAVYTTFTEGTTMNRDYTNPSGAEGATTPGWHKAVYTTQTAEGGGKTQRQQNNSRSTVIRVADVMDGRVKMDEGFCRQKDDLCKKWRTDIQITLDAVNRLLETSPDAQDDSGSDVPPEPLLLSYVTEGGSPGSVQVTLLTANALYLLKGAGCMELDDSGAKGVADANGPAPFVSRSGLCGAKADGQQAGEHNAASAEGSVKTSADE